ncbi:tetraspanin-32 isoform X2 [Mus pahari]|uniref:tetraspanin-32 isoform X2 n=1 Tax=Mus pahari TaxID=10093 RepID=UPI000A30C544|nr:tetraspanin-32 isoform X2 [Mus pahari]
MAVVTHFGDHFTVIGHASLERNPYETLRYWAFYVGISLAGLLSLGAALSTIATVKEAHGLMAAGFLCFALSFCILVQVAFWRFHNPTQFLCCGKKSPFGLEVSTGASMCQGQEAMREVYAMMLCAFLWFAIHSYRGLDRKGRYSLTPRSRGCQAQEPSLFRWT